MKIEQAKALKVGDDMVRTKASDYTTVGRSYTVNMNCGEYIQYTDDDGDDLTAAQSTVADCFDLPPASSPTQWIPFDKERMSEAEGYRIDNDYNELVTEVVVVGGSIAFLVDGKFGHCTIASRTLEMLAPVVVKYPCLCRHIRTDAMTIVKVAHPSWTPLTTDELAEIGLKQIS